MAQGGLTNSFRRYVVFVALILCWICQDLPAQTPLSPVINPAGLEDQRLNLLSPEGYQLIEQANQALELGLSNRAEDRISQLLYEHTDVLVPLPDDQDIPFRSFHSIPQFAKAWYFINSELLTHDLGPQELEKQAKAIRSGIIASLKYTSFFAQHTIKTNWNLAICDSLILHGDLSAARSILAQHSTAPIVEGNSTYTGKWRFVSDAKSPDQLKVGVRYVILDILEGREVAALKRMKSLQSMDSKSFYSLGGLHGSLQDLLNGFFQQHFGGTDPAAGFLPQVQVAQTAGQRNSGERAFGKGVVWQRDVSSLLDGKGLEQKLNVRFMVVGERLFANTLNGILALNLETGKPLFGEQDEAFWLVRNQQQETADWFDFEIPYWGNSTPVVEVAGDLLAARQGDPALTHHQSVDAGSIQGNSVVVLDLAEQGRMLDGFPLTLPQPRKDSYQVFATPPKIVGEQLLIGIRENQAFQCRHYLASYDLDGGRLNWKCYVGSARPIANRTITDLTSGGLDVIGTKAIFTTNTGMVAAVDLSGQLHWVCTYPRSYHTLASAELETRTVRRSTAGFDRNEMAVVIAPADSANVFSLDLRTGLLTDYYSENDLGWAEVLVTPRGRVLLCGDRLWYLRSVEHVSRTPIAITEPDSDGPFGVCQSGGTVYRVNGNRELTVVSWDERSGEAMVQVSLPAIPFATQIQMSDRLAVFFDGKMITAVEAAPMVKTEEK